jgi:putative transposase
MPTVIRTYKYRLLPNKRQHADLRQTLEDQRQLYNAALESRVDCYRKTGKGITFFDQCKELTELRKEESFASTVRVVQVATLRRLDRAYQSFFQRLKRGKNPGFPRFKGKGWWNSFGLDDPRRVKLVSGKIRLKGISGGIRVHFHRPMPEGKTLSCQFRREAKGWYICFIVRIATELLPATGRSIGVDMGISSLAILSNGEVIPNIRSRKLHERELRRRQRHLSRCRKGSNSRRKARDAVARLHAKIRNTRHTHLHQVSSKLVRVSDLIAIEKLNVRGMASSMLAKSVNDAAWSTLMEFLTYKAEGAGRQIIEVDPRNTTQACSGCGVIVPKDLNQRWHDCSECGLSLDRDVNAARNILARAVVRPWVANVAQSGASVHPEISG